MEKMSSARTRNNANRTPQGREATNASPRGEKGQRGNRRKYETMGDSDDDVDNSNINSSREWQYERSFGSSSDELNYTFELDVDEDNSPRKVKRSQLQRRALPSKHTYREESSFELMKSKSASSPFNQSSKSSTHSPHGYLPKQASYPAYCNPSKSKSIETEMQCSGINCWLYILIAIVIILVILPNTSMWRNSSRNDTGKVDRKDALRNFSGHLVTLKEEFVHQKPRFWQTIGASIKRIIGSENPTFPAVIMLVHSEADHDTVNCISKRLAQDIAISYGINQQAPLDINILQSLSSMTEENAKLTLDETLNKYLARGGKVVVMRNLHYLPSSAAAFLHGVCDNDSAPYKDVVILFTLEVPSHKIKVYNDAAVEETLYSLWANKLGNDNVGALLSRIANNIAFVQKEPLCA